MKHIYFLLFLIFINCSVFQKVFMKKDPEFIIKNVKLKNVNLEGFTVKLDTELINYYKFGLPKSKLNFDIKINENLLTKYTSNEFEVAAESSVAIPIYLDIKYLDIAKIIKEFATSEFLKLNLNGGAKFLLNIPGFPKEISIPFQVEKTIPSFMPSVQIQDMNMELENTKFQDFLVGNTKLKINLKFLIENKGGSSFKLHIKDTFYRLENQNLINIDTKEFENNAKQQVLDLSSEIPIQENIKKVFQALMGNQTLNYNFESKLKFQFEKVDLNEFEFPIKYHGNISTKK